MGFGRGHGLRLPEIPPHRRSSVLAIAPTAKKEFTIPTRASFGRSANLHLSGLLWAGEIIKEVDGQWQETRKAPSSR